MRQPHDSHDREHHHGGGRRQRFFGHGELRLVILQLLRNNASHGYEIIKAIETLTQGNYTPSPGVIYPTLDLLRDQQLIAISDEENGRRMIAITAQGEQWLEENEQQLAQIQARVKARNVGYQLRKNPQMKRALENFKAVLDLRVNQEEISAAQLKQIIGIIDRAALDISQLD
ncbi:PadR family transcriptional regulator [Kosakonia sp. BYX6]|uniref:PadR family transcriptional regulator n=1 Tax=Kosakonia calanthes TaxID=3139408 RepID=A0ABZ3B8A2_9ENTR